MCLRVTDKASFTGSESAKNQRNCVNYELSLTSAVFHQTDAVERTEHLCAYVNFLAVCLH